MEADYLLIAIRTFRHSFDTTRAHSIDGLRAITVMVKVIIFMDGFRLLHNRVHIGQLFFIHAMRKTEFSQIALFTTDFKMININTFQCTHSKIRPSLSQYWFIVFKVANIIEKQVYVFQHLYYTYHLDNN